MPGRDFDDRVPPEGRGRTAMILAERFLGFQAIGRAECIRPDVDVRRATTTRIGKEPASNDQWPDGILRSARGDRALMMTRARGRVAPRAPNIGGAVSNQLFTRQNLGQRRTILLRVSCRDSDNEVKQALDGPLGLANPTRTAWHMVCTFSTQR